MNPREGGSGSAASVRGRLRELARRRGLEFQLVLSEYAIERLLYRLGASIHRDRFVVKGATLFRIWAVGDRRATWDLDLLGRVWVAKSPSQGGNGLPRACGDSYGRVAVGLMCPGDGPKKGQMAVLETRTGRHAVWGTRWPASGGPDVEKSPFL